MSDEEIIERLRERGYPEHVWKGGAAGLVERWRQIVEEVERGYALGLDDYRNDLDLRAIIAEVGLDGRVRDLDERFQAMLTARDQRVWHSSPRNPFWDYGYPKNASGELLEDLQAEGLA